jgi:DNA polymerase delta subunit 1
MKDKGRFYRAMEIVSHAFNWDVEDGFTDDGRAEIRAWTLGRGSEPHLLRFQDFPVFCHLELPMVVGRTMNFRWTSDSVDRVFKYLTCVLDEDAPEKAMFKMSEKLYYYRPGESHYNRRKYPMLLLTFKSMKAMQHCENLLNKPRDIPGLGMIMCRMWETGVGIVRKMLSLRKVRYSQWFKVKGDQVRIEDKISTLHHEYIVSWQTMDPIPQTETQSWITHPGVLSFDIETYTDNHNAMPNKYNARHTAYMVSAIYQRTGLQETRKKYKILIGECEDIPDVIIIKVTNEIELCNALTDIIAKEDPDIITGYNIFGYDYPYLDARLKRRLQDWGQNSSRLINKAPYFAPKAWKSSGYGYNQIDIVHFPGRISIDMLPLIRRDYKLPKYDLNTVSKRFINRGKHDVDAKEMFRIYEQLQVSTYLYSKCVKDWIIDDQGNDKPIYHDIEDAEEKLRLANSLYQDCVKWKPIFHDNIEPDILIQIEKMYEDAKVQMTRVGAYCVEDSELVIDIFEKIGVWVGLIEMSNIVGVPIMDIFTRGQQVRGVSQIYDLATSLNVVLDQRVTERIDWSGGFVFEPNPGLYDYVLCLDFKSLYPSIMIAYNICYTTLLGPELDQVIPDDMCNIIEWTEQPDKDKDEEGEMDEDFDEDGQFISKKGSPREPTHYRFRFIKKEYKEGILPQLVGNLIKERNIVRGEQKKATDPVIWNVLEKRQLALKVSANSMFGMLGVQEGGKIPLIEGAMSITAKGRELIQTCNKYLVDTYDALIVYNDTDSTMFTLPMVSSNEETLEWGHKLEKETSALFPDPLCFEFEKGGRMFCVRKKKYSFWMIDSDKEIRNPKNKDEWITNNNYTKLRDPETDPDAIMMKGLILARRDNCLWQRETYQKVIYNIMNRKPRQETLDLILESALRMYRNQVDWKDLVIIRGLGANYKNDSYFMKIFGDEIRKLGKPASPGDRLEYVIVKPYNGVEGQLVGYRMRLPETYIERLDSSEPEYIDTQYYLENVLMNCIEQLWRVGYREELDQLELENSRESHMYILSELSSIGYNEQVKYYYQALNGDPIATVDYMLHTDLKNKVIDARRKYISGRHIFDMRVSKTPIKTLVKSIKEGLFDETVKFQASPELYKQLYQVS